MPEPSSTQHQIKEVLGFPATTDKRRAVDRRDTRNDAAVSRYGTAVAAGTLTTLIVLNEDAEYYRDALRFGYTLDLYDSGLLSAGPGRTITSVTNNLVTGQSTVTFTPALVAPTVAGEFFVRAGSDPGGRNYEGINQLDVRLSGFAPYTGVGAGAQRLLDMNVNDKQYALRMIDDRPSGVAEA